MPNIFISHIPENRTDAQRLSNALNRSGVQISTRNTVPPGGRRKQAVRRAIHQACFFIACFSEDYYNLERTDMNEDIALAIEELRKYHTDRSWLIPVRFSDCDVPDIDIGPGETLQDLVPVDLYDNWDAGVEQLRSVLQSMLTDDAADAERTRADGLISAVEEMETRKFSEWMGGSEATIALVFTDVVGSTALGVELGDEAMGEVRRAHFRQARGLIERYGGYEVKTIGDSFMVAFRTAVKALDFALELHRHTGHQRVKIRAGIHVGPVHVDEEDAFGTMVNYTARVESQGKGAELWASARAMSDIKAENAVRHRAVRWREHPNCELKGFEAETHTLWSVIMSDIADDADAGAGAELVETPSPGSGESSLSEEEKEFLRDLLARHQQNLRLLLKQKSVFGAGDEPLRLLNQIAEEEKAIREIEGQLAQ
jgi:class 3 adenylate cyclase